MLAVSRDYQKVFLYEPRIGMSVPILLDVTTRTVNVAVPSVAELETEFAAVEQLEEVKQAIPGYSKLLDAAVRFSKFYTREFRTEIDSKDVSVKKLRKLIRGHYEGSDSLPETSVHGTAKVPVFESLAASVDF